MWSEVRLLTPLSESDVEQAALECLEGLGWQVAHGPDIGPEGLNSERADFGQVVLERRLQAGCLIQML